MRIRERVDSLERHFPLLEIEGEYIISKHADITACFRVDLPELFTLSSEDYEMLHTCWTKAFSGLENQTIVHKQDWFIFQKHEEDLNEHEAISFLDYANRKHFKGRSYLKHSCYLFITKSTEKRLEQQSLFSSLCKKHLVPAEQLDPILITNFKESVFQFERIMNDSDLIRLTRLTEKELLGDAEQLGLIDHYLSLSGNEQITLEDICLGSEHVRVGDKQVISHSLSNVDDLPFKLSTDRLFDKLSTDRSSCSMSFASPIGILCTCNHIYNQYIIIGDSEKNLKDLDRKARHMNALSRYSRSNAINAEWIQDYLNIAHTLSCPSVKAHFNVLSWTEHDQELRSIKNEVGSAIAKMGCTPRHNTIDTATLFWAGIPGNAGDLPSEEMFFTFFEPAICLFSQETNYRDYSLEPEIGSQAFGLRLADRLSGKPILLDISDYPMKKGLITNRNKFILGPSGSGKSFFTNHLVRQYYEQNAHILLVDIGDSYGGLCRLIHEETKGADGISFRYSEADPISFNPFYTDDYIFSNEKITSIVSLIFILWKHTDEELKKSEISVLNTAIQRYIHLIQEDRSIRPCFNTFYDFMKGRFKEELEADEEIRVTTKEFDLNNFLVTLKPFYQGGHYDFLLNSSKDIDLLNKRFIVFELDEIQKNNELLSIVTMIIMETFINKMRRLPNQRKLILIEEAWKALTTANMEEYIKYLYKTVRKHFGEAIVVTQELDDIIHSPVVKESIINNSDCKILLDQRKYMNKFDTIQDLLGLTSKEVDQLLSINQNNDPKRSYKEVFISLGGRQSAVYATEVSKEEYFCYTTEPLEKVELIETAKTLGGSFKDAIKQTANKYS